MNSTVRMVAWAELTSEEAGKALGIPAGTARSRLHRARKHIRKALADFDQVDTSNGRLG